MIRPRRCRFRWLAAGMATVCGFALSARAQLGPTAPQVIALDRYTVWKYDDTGTDLGTAWREPEFDDSGWASGPGFLGYGENMVTTEISYGSDPANKHRTAYFRTTFTIGEDPGDIQRLLLGANYDDGAVLYLNGVEVARANMPAGPIVYGTFASSTGEGEGHEHIDLTPFIGELVTGENTLAAEVHQRTLTSSDLIWDMKLQYTTEATMIARGPYLQLGSPSGATVRWRTDQPHRGRLWYGTDPEDLSTAITEAVSTDEHEVSIVGLEPATRYYYAIGTSADLVLVGGDDDYSFRTHPPVGTSTETIRVWAIGDGGEANNDQVRARDSYLAHPDADETDVWLLLGDNAYDSGTDDEYQSALFEELCAMLRRTFMWPTRGNHDNLHTGFDYYDVFTLPDNAQSGGVASGTEAYYSFDYGNVHFVCLDSDGTDRSVDSAMLTWLESDLAATTQQWLIAYWHHPPYTKGSHDSDDTGDSSGRMRDMRENALPILEAYGVDFVLTGHSHSYERSYLIDEHYGPSTTLADSMILNYGSGSDSDGAPYTKPTNGLTPHEGTVYAVSGSFSFTQGGPLNHPVMRVSLVEMGSMVLDIDGARLDASFLDATGVVRDDFTILKGTTIDVEDASSNSAALELRLLENPVRGRSSIRYSVEENGPVSIRVFGASGRRVRELANDPVMSGTKQVTWDGRDDTGVTVAAGVYYLVMRTEKDARVKKIVVVP